VNRLLHRGPARCARGRKVGWCAVLLAAVAVLAGACAPPPPGEAPGIDVATALGGSVRAGFARAEQPRAFSFPADHNAHPDFRNEWWYVTGHLRGPQGQRFAWQVTFFRIALGTEAPSLDSDWATRQLWMAHVALADLDAGVHRHAERFARQSIGLAGQQSTPFRLWLEDWQLVGGPGGVFPWRLEVDSGEFALQLELEPLRTPLLQGEAGLSQKGSAAGNASYYYSITRLATRGRLRRGDVSLAVSGQSWLDREWSSSALEDGQVGWDWFSLQLDDDTDLMLYRLRRSDGSADSHSAGSLLRADGSVLRLTADDFSLQPRRYWQAPDGARYPVGWRLRVPAAGLELDVEALLDTQLMDTAVTYWEGAVGVRDAADGRSLGRGFLEMTGY
jgi:predicted secreted hydrolase